jgi:hypothetical protein
MSLPFAFHVSSEALAVEPLLAGITEAAERYLPFRSHSPAVLAFLKDVTVSISVPPTEPDTEPTGLQPQILPARRKTVERAYASLLKRLAIATSDSREFSSGESPDTSFGFPSVSTPKVSFTWGYSTAAFEAVCLTDLTPSAAAKALLSASLADELVHDLCETLVVNSLNASLPGSGSSIGTLDDSLWEDAGFLEHPLFPHEPRGWRAWRLAFSASKAAVCLPLIVG